MSLSPFNPHVVPLLQGVKPYLGTQGQSFTDGILSLINLLASQPGQQAIEAVSKLFLLPGRPGKEITVHTASGPITLNLSSAFTLFLILILLILSTNTLSFGPVVGNPPANPNPAG